MTDPAPPTPQRYVRPRHDAAGRIAEAEIFTGTGAQAAKSWEHWIKREVARQIEGFARLLGAEMAQIVRQERDQLVARINRGGAAVERQEQRRYPILPRRPPAASKQQRSRFGS